MSVESIGMRIGLIQQQLVAVGAGHTPSTSTSFADQLAGAQSTAATGATTTAATTLAGGTPTRYDGQITAAATRYGIDPALLKGLIRQESNFEAGAQSGAGAQGLTQLMPGTAASLGVDPSDPAQAIDGGARYLKQQLDRFGGDASKALAAYNAGPGAVAKYGGVPPYAETQSYVDKVLGYAAEYRGTATAVPVTTTPVSAASLLAGADTSDDPSSSTSSPTLDYSTI